MIFFVSIAFSFIPANFITLIIKERETNSKHLQIISGISLISYWLNNYIFELIKYYIVGGICILLIYLFEYYKYYLIFLYLEYGTAMVSFTYLFSFICKSENKGQSLVLLINLLLGTIGGTAVLIMKLNEDIENISTILAYILRIIPSFSFCYGYSLLLNEDFLRENKNFHDILEFQFVKGDFVYLGVESVLYLLFLILFENSNRLYMACSPKKKSKISKKNNTEMVNCINFSLNDVDIPENAKG